MEIEQRKPNPGLRRLDPLVGDWDMRAQIGGASMHARTTFGWLEEGVFLRQHADAEPVPGMPPELAAHSPFPVAAIIGLDDRTDTFSYLYADGRGVCRVYRMNIGDGGWAIWGQAAPEFFQRFEGTFGDGGRTIAARWEKSADGRTWELDFDLTYTKLD